MKNNWDYSFDMLKQKCISDFIKNYQEYEGQPSVYLLIVQHLDNPDYNAICYVSLNEYEAKEWENSECGEGLKRFYKRILLYKKEEKKVKNEILYKVKK